MTAIGNPRKVDLGKMLSAAATILAVASNFSWPAELWVDRNSLGGPCSDSRSRFQISQSMPWCTIGRAAVGVLPGDAVYVREGEYSEVQTCATCWGAVLQTVVSGSQSAPIRFAAYADESVVITDAGGASWGILVIDNGDVVPRFIEIAGFEVRGGFQYGCAVVSDTSDVRLSRLNVTDCGVAAVKLKSTSRVTLEGSSVHHNALGGWTSAVNLFLCDADNVVRGNAIWANTDEDPRATEGHGIILDGCSGTGTTLIENNLIWHNEGRCVNVYNSDGATIRNNTCWMNSLDRVSDHGELYIRGSYASLYNNILVPRDGKTALRIYGWDLDYSTIASDHNLLWSPFHEDVVSWPPYNVGTLDEFQAVNGYKWDANSIQADPQVDETPLHFLELTAGSPAIDTGYNLQAPLEDHAGFERPLDGDGDGSTHIDIGAFEYGGLFLDGFDSGSLASWSHVVESEI